MGAWGATGEFASASDLSLSWTDNSSNETGFTIERSTDGSNFVQIASVGENVTSYVDMGLVGETTYHYRVQAYNSAGASDYSNVASAAPSMSVLENGGFGVFESGVAVGWSIQNAGGVEVVLSEDAGQTGQAQKIDITTASGWGMFFYQQPNLVMGKTYEWTFWYKTDAPTDTSALTASVTNGPHSATVLDLQLPGTDGTWQKVEQVFTYDNADVDMVRIAAATPGSYWIDGMSLVEVAPVAVPVFSPGGGAFSSGQSVSISSATLGATIRYTTNGATPSATSGTLYSGPISVSSSATLRAIAYDSGMNNSAVTSATYTITLPALNTAPTVSSVSNQVIDENASTDALAFTVGDAETSADSLSVSGSSSNSSLVPTGNIAFGGSGPNRTVTITPAAGQIGAATITITVGDGELTASSNFDVNVATSSSSTRLINLSSRGYVSDGDPMIAGFSVGGDGPQTLLIRAVGKSLEKFGITDVVGEPVISIVPSKSGSTMIQTDGGWDESTDLDALVAAMTEAGAFTLEKGSKDAAILLRLDPGLYTAVVEDSSRKGGTSLVEVYALDDDLEIVSGRLLNLSTRGYVGNGKDVLIAGLVIRGQQAQRVLIRGIGPKLGAFGVTNVVSDPEIKIYASGVSEAFATNDDWSVDSAEASVIAAVSKTVGAFSLPQGSTDAALVLNLNPGMYTVHLSPARGTGGTGLVEVYVVP